MSQIKCTSRCHIWKTCFYLFILMFLALLRHDFSFFICLAGTVISLCQTGLSTQRHYSHSTQCPGVPSPASGLLWPPPFSHPWGASLIIVRIPIRRWKWFNLLHMWFLCPIWYWQPLTTPAALQSFCKEADLWSNIGVGIEFGHVLEQAIRPWEKIVLDTAETINRIFQSCVEWEYINA